MGALNQAVMDLEELLGDFAKLSELPEDVKMQMLDAEADVVVEAHINKISELGLVSSGQMLDSIARQRGNANIDIYPQGTRANGVRNAEVGFIHEFGAPQRNIPAKGWMESANEECADDAVAAAAVVYNQYLEKLNL